MDGERRRVALLLPGQGAQRERMAAGTPGGFTRRMIEFFDAAGAEGERLRERWLRPAPHPELDESATSQPLLFAVGHALGMVLRDEGHAPDLLLGHSVGELAAACLAGVFAAGDIPALMAARARALADARPGGMLAVAAAPHELPAGLPADVVVAAVNGPRQTVLAGPDGPLDTARDLLRAADRTVRALRSRHAFHSPAMAPAAALLGVELGGMRLNPPGSTVISTRTAAPVRADEATDPRFWADQLVLPVLFWPALRRLLDTCGARPGVLLLDASADRGLSAAARRHPAVLSGASRVLPLLAGARETGGPADAAVFGAAVRALASAHA